MMLWRLSVLVIVVTMVVTGAAPALAQQSIDGWSEMRRDMEMFKGALERTVANTVLNTYIPDFGVVILFTVKFGLSEQDVRRDIERALTYVTPTIERLAPGERIVIAGYSTGLFSDWELLYIATKDSSADPSTWDVYRNSTR